MSPIVRVDSWRRALPAWAVTVLTEAAAWCWQTRCWQWWTARRRVRARVSDVVETDRDGRDFRRRLHPDDDTEVR